MRDAPLRMFLHATRILTDTKTDTEGDSPKKRVLELKNRTTPAFDAFQRVRQYAGGLVPSGAAQYEPGDA